MAYNPIGVKLLRDEDELPIPQYYDPATAKMKPLEDPRLVQLTGSIVQETKNETNASNGTVTFSKTIKQIGIFNKSNTDGTFNVNGLDIFVPARGSFTNPIGGTPRATVTITGATSYALQRYE